MKIYSVESPSREVSPGPTTYEARPCAACDFEAGGAHAVFGYGSVRQQEALLFQLRRPEFLEQASRRHGMVGGDVHHRTQVYIAVAVGVSYTDAVKEAEGGHF